MATDVFIIIANDLSTLPRMRILADNPVLRYSFTVKPGTTTSNTIRGLHPNILKLYAPNTPWLVNQWNTLEIPHAWYIVEMWPYDSEVRDGRPFSNIFYWIKQAFSSPQEVVAVKIQLKLDELCSYLSVCQLLGMRDQAGQLEQTIKKALQSRPIEIKEAKAVWHYHNYSPNPMPGVLGVPKGFTDNEIMRLYAKNLREFTTILWRDNPAYSDTTAEYFIFINDTPELWSLLYRPNLHTWVAMYQRVPDKDWAKNRLNAWLRENHRTFGEKPRAHTMPVIHPQHFDHMNHVMWS